MKEVKEIGQKCGEIYSIEAQEGEKVRHYYLRVGIGGLVNFQYSGLSSDPYIGEFTIDIKGWPIKSGRYFPDFLDIDKKRTHFVGKVAKITQLNEQDISNNGCKLSLQRK